MDDLEMQLRHSHVILDTCCILNFCASGHFLDILHSIPAQIRVAEDVRRKELLSFQWDDETNGGQNGNKDCQFEMAIAKNLLSIVDFESDDEAATFLDYLVGMNGDDGEAATGAIAFHRNWAIATDDRRATNFLKRVTPQLQIVTTPEVIQHWSTTTKLTATKLSLVLKTIRKRGKYMPPKVHPLFSWWQEATNNS